MDMSNVNFKLTKNRPLTALIEDDSKSFHALVSSELQQRAELKVIDEASDGLNAVEKAEKLRPR
jgi:chemotaxis response regulator CheB